MFKYLNYILRLIIFWIVLFFFQRLIFIVFQTAHYDCVNFSNLMLCNWYSLGLDISMTSYFLSLPVILLAVFNYNGRKIIRRILFIYFTIFIISSSLILIFDIGLFAEWGSKIKKQSGLLALRQYYFC